MFHFIVKEFFILKTFCQNNLCIWLLPTHATYYPINNSLSSINYMYMSDVLHQNKFIIKN